jgi:hypothetical protein
LTAVLIDATIIRGVLLPAEALHEPEAADAPRPAPVPA